MSKENTFRANNFALLLYTETESYDIQSVLNTVRELDDCRYAYCLHNRDTTPDGEIKKEHIHLLLHFDNARYNTGVSDLLNVPLNFVQKCKTWKKAAQYLIHLNNPEKFQYSPDDVAANYDYRLDLDKDSSEAADAQKLYDYIIQNNCVSMSDLMAYAIQNNLYATLRRGSSLFNQLLRENIKHRYKLGFDAQKVMQDYPDEPDFTKGKNKIGTAEFIAKYTSNFDKDRRKLRDGVMFDL